MDLDLLNVLHTIDKISYVPKEKGPQVGVLRSPTQTYNVIKSVPHHPSICCTKNVKNQMVALKENTENPLCIYDMKKVLELRLQIRRTGLVLARHAEENALSKYRANIGVRGRKRITPRKLHMVVIRINNSDEIIESKPCSHCVEVMRAYGIRKVTYSTKDGNLVTESLALIISQPSVGYRSVERTLNILDEMVKHMEHLDSG